MKHAQHVFIALVVGLVLGVGGVVVTRPAPAPAPAQPAEAPPEADASNVGAATWLKGQLHTHSANSPDSRTDPGRVLEWYAEHGFDFVVLTDHNHLATPPRHERVLAIPGVELTQNLRTCDPPPEPGMHCLLHVNALFVDPAKGLGSFPPSSGSSRLERYSAALETAKALGGIAQLNHPNFHYAADVDLIEQLARRGVLLMEIANVSEDSNNEGDRHHPSTERLWDLALSRGVRIWGTATDDAHHYDDAEALRARGEPSYVGNRGWVMVRAQRDPLSIRRALEQGQFYATTGVLLDRIELVGTRIEIDAHPSTEGELYFAFYGQNGEFLGDTRGRKARLDLGVLSTPYARATVTDARGQKAWTQPLYKPQAR